MVDRKKFLEKVEEIRREQPKYRNGGSAEDGTCDCIGLIIAAIKRAGGTWPKSGAHGTNYAARNEVEDLKKITSVSDLYVSAVVFKALGPLEDDWDLPSRYKDDPDQNDYFHVGVVWSVEPLIIIHCTTPSVTIDLKLGSWDYVAKLKRVEGGTGQVAEAKKAIVDRPAGVTGNTVNLRKGAGTSYDRIEKIEFGTELEVMADLGDWCYVKVGSLSGYMQSNYILYDEAPDTEEDDPVGLTEEDREKLLEALTKLDETRELIVQVVGRG